MHGYGLQTWPNGKSYEGTFQNDVKNGYGTYQWADSSVYQGQWLNGKQHGDGVYTSVNGHTTVGVWQNGKRIKSQDRLPQQSQKPQIQTNNAQEDDEQAIYAEQEAADEL
jgi:hypothetical protein